MQRSQPMETGGRRFLNPFPTAQQAPTAPAAPIEEESSEGELTLAEIAATKPPIKVVREFFRAQLESIGCDDEFS
jgi:hypothetical protein